MEGLAAAGGVIAVVSIAGQVLQGCSYLCNIFDNAKGAPQEIHLLVIELKIIEAIVQKTPNDAEHQYALDFCNGAIARLREVVDRYGDLDGTTKMKMWGKRLRMALNMEKIQKHLGRLREAKRELEDLLKM